MTADFNPCESCCFRNDTIRLTPEQLATFLEIAKKPASMPNGEFAKQPNILVKIGKALWRVIY